MNCSRAQQKLPDLAAWRSVAGEHDGEFVEVAAHVADCATCRAALASLQANLAQADALLAADLQAVPSPDFAARVRERIRVEEPGDAKLGLFDWLRARPAWHFALPVAAVALLGVVLISRMTPPGPMPANQVVRDVAQPAAPPTSTAAPAQSPVAASAPAVNRAATSANPTAPAAQPAPLVVVVTPGQFDAIWKLYDASRKQQVNGESIVAQRPSIEESLRPIALTPIELRRVEVPPIEAGQSEKGASSGSEKAGPGAGPKR